MLIAILVVLTVVGWVSMACVYFRLEIYHWFDNRFGPPSRPRKPERPRRRMYD